MVKTVAMYLCLLCGAVQITWAQSYDEYWKEIEKAQRAALPQTVLKLTEEVRKKALKEHKIPQLLRATICRNYYSERLTPDSLYTHLAELEQWVAKETDQVNRAILHSLLAGEYSLYMLNHYRPLQALTQLSEKQQNTDSHHKRVCQARTIPLGGGRPQPDRKTSPMAGESRYS